MCSVTLCYLLGEGTVLPYKLAFLDCGLEESQYGSTDNPTGTGAPVGSIDRRKGKNEVEKTQNVTAQKRTPANNPRIMCPSDSSRVRQNLLETIRHGGHDNGSTSDKARSNVAGMVDEDRGMPFERDVGKGLVCGTRNHYQDILLRRSENNWFR